MLVQNKHFEVITPGSDNCDGHFSLFPMFYSDHMVPDLNQIFDFDFRQFY